MTEAEAAAAAAKPRILVISTSGLGRFVPALGAMGAIRAYHRDARVVLLTGPSTAAFAATAPYFDEIWTDDSEGTLHLRRLWALRAQLKAAAFDRVYDLDATPHSQRLFWLMYGRRALPSRRGDTPWSGTIPATAFQYGDPRRAAMHLVDRWAAQLKVAGIGAILRPDLSWVARHVEAFTLPFRMTEPFVMLSATPGPGAPWSAERFGELAQSLIANGQIPVMVGTDVPTEICTVVREFCPGVVDLTGKATMNELVFLAWAATAAVGPDNGVMHLTAAAGCHTIILFDGASDPALVGQRGNRVSILRRRSLAEIPVGEIIAAVGTRKK